MAVKTYRITKQIRQPNVHGDYITTMIHVTAGNIRGAKSAARRHDPGCLIVKIEDCTDTPVGVTIWTLDD